MPKINRIRIVNFSYNGEKRLILDELFNFHKGENALFSLKNGGGKSVLVQAMMQPILPNQVLQKRKMSDFFVKKKLPAYILIEWRLDEDGGYLLTGICMTSKESLSQEQEDEGNSIKFFTFTTSYRNPDKFDIQRIPLVRKENNRIIVSTFKEAQDLLQVERKYRPNIVNVFSDQEKKAYQTHLLSYNINSDEWNTIIVPINSEEGGIIKIFEKCKTSRQLLREWILKTVNKVLFDDPSESQSLQHMMAILAQTMIDNEEFVLERNLLKGFTENLQKISDEVCDMATTYGEELELREQLQSLDRFLEEEIRKISMCIEEDLLKMEEQEKQKIRISQEKISHYYYVAKNYHEASRVRTDQLKKNFDEFCEQRDNLIHQIAIMDAMEIREDLLEIEKKLAGVETELSRLNDQSEDREMIGRLTYSLKVAYHHQLEEIREELTSKNQGLEILEEERIQIKDEIERNEETCNKLKVKEINLKHAVDRFKKEEENLSIQLAMVFQRNLMGGLDLKEANSMQRNLEILIENVTEKLESLKLEISDLNQEDEEIQRMIPEAAEKIVETRLLHSKKEEEIEAFLQKEEALRRCMEKYNLNLMKRFNKDYLQREFKQIIIDSQEKLDGHKEEIRNLKKRESALRNGILHVSEEYQDYLKKSGILFETGESYLQSQTSEIRQKLLKSIPLLPYAFLMTEEELEKVKSQRPERPLLQPVPVMAYSLLEGKEEDLEFIVDLGKGMTIFCYPDKKLFESEGIEAYKMDLLKELDSEEKSRKHYEEQLKTQREDETLVHNFTYTENWLKSAQIDEKKLDIELSALIEQKNNLIQRQKELKVQQSELTKNLKHQEKEKERIEKNHADFKKHLEENKIFEVNYREKMNVEDELKVIGSKILEQKKRMDNLENLNSKASKDIWSIEHEEETMKTESLAYEHAGEKLIVEGTRILLMERLKKYQQNVDTNLDRLNGNRQELLKSLDKGLRKLKDTGIHEEEYGGRMFRPFEKVELTQEKKSIDEEYTKSNIAFHESDKETSRFLGNLENQLKELQKLIAEPLEQEEIRSNFTARKSACDEVIRSLKISVKDYNEMRNEYKGVSDKIHFIASKWKISGNGMKWIPEKNIKESYEKLNTRLSQLNDAISEKRNGIQLGFSELQRLYSDKNHSLSSILDSFSKMLRQAELDYEKYYYLYEHTENQLEKLKQRIQVNEIQLAKMEENFNDIVMQSYNQAKEIYDHVNRVADDSSIKLEGRSRNVKMIEILLKDLGPDDKGFEAMSRYIRERSEEVMQQLKNGRTKREIQDMVAKFMSSEELLNVVSDLSDLRIKAFKIDINDKHSQAKDWEKVMRENSGGERFVSFFAVMIALMSYSRNSRKLLQDSNKNNDTKVLLMDNPFGPISSEHLLKPLFEISKKYHTQLICLTDLKQNSIMNQFKVIFMLKIVGNTTGTMEYLTVEEDSYNEHQGELNENLEMVNYHFQEKIEQISLLDGIAE